jgi:hypothetical protein
MGDSPDWLARCDAQLMGLPGEVQLNGYEKF